MKTLIYNNEKLNAEKIIKTDTSIIGMDINNNVIFLLKGISDFSSFKLSDNLGNDIEFAIEDKSELELLKYQNSQMIIALIKGGLL